jgi:hypothetical protein
MKKAFRVLGIIALVAIVGFSMAACDDGNGPGGYTPGGGQNPGGGGTNPGGGGSDTSSLDGVWKSHDTIITVNGSNGVFTDLGTPNALGQSAIDKGYIRIGTQYYKSLNKTGDRAWTGQKIMIYYNTNAPNVATGTYYADVTITLSADGKTFQEFAPGGSTPTDTWTKQ